MIKRKEKDLKMEKRYKFFCAHKKRLYFNYIVIKDRALDKWQYNNNIGLLNFSHTLEYGIRWAWQLSASSAMANSTDQFSAYHSPRRTVEIICALSTRPPITIYRSGIGRRATAALKWPKPRYATIIYRYLLRIETQLEIITAYAFVYNVVNNCNFYYIPIAVPETDH